MRSGPGVLYGKKGVVAPGSVQKIKAMKDGWGQLRSNGYWIKLKYTTIIDGYKVRIRATDLNMRTGPGVLHGSKGHAKPGLYVITKIDDGWGKLKINGYWVKLSYTVRVK